MPNYTYPDIDPDDPAIKNKLGIKSHDDLERISAALVAMRIVEITAGKGPQASFDAAHLKAIHHHLFQDVFEWAGHTRNEPVRLSDGTVATEPLLRKVDGSPFLPGAHIADALERVEDKLHGDKYLAGLSRDVFAERAADLIAEINAIHPFREGNGRTQRVFVEQLAQQAGHELDFSVVTHERMVRASIAANEQDDNGEMRRMFREISDPVRVEALRKALDNMRALRFPIQDRYIATAEPGHRVEVTLAGIAGDQFMARTSTEILIGQVSDLPKPRPVREETFILEPTSWDRGGRPTGRGGRGR